MKILLLIIFYSMTALPTISQVKGEETGRSKNIHQPEYCLLYDNHNMPAIPDVGKNFDVEKGVQKLFGHFLFEVVAFSYILKSRI